MNLWITVALSGLLLWWGVRQLSHTSAQHARQLLRGGLVALFILTLSACVFNVKALGCDVTGFAGLWLQRAQWILVFLGAGFALFRHHRALKWLQSEKGPLSATRTVPSSFSSPIDPLPVKLSSQVEVPQLFGAFKSQVLFPKELWSQLTVQDRELILFHEEAHHRGGDILWRGFASLFWIFCLFHPVLWLLRRELFALDEYVADDWSLEKTGAPRQNLVRLFLNLPGVTAGAGSGRIFTVAFAVAFPGNRISRAQRLLHTPVRSRWFRGLLASLGMSLWLLTTVTASAVESQWVRPAVNGAGFVFNQTEIRLSILNPLLGDSNFNHHPQICRRTP